MAKDHPASFSTARWHLIDTLGRLQTKRKNAVPALAFREGMPEEHQGDFRKNLGNFFQNRSIWITREPNVGGERGNKYLYKLTTEGMQIYKKLDTIAKVDFPRTPPKPYKNKGEPKDTSPGAPKSAYLLKKERDLKKEQQRQSVIQPTLNISSAADTLADMTATVVQENSNLRDLMISSCSNMAMQLGYKLVKVEGEDNGGNEATS